MNLIKRHLHLFFINPSNLMISSLSVIVILALYFLFVRDFTIKALNEIQVNKQNLELYVDLLMVSGLLIVIAAISCLPICSIFVKDKESGIIKDFLISPISKINIYFSYILASTIISILITLLSFIIILTFFYLQYDFNLKPNIIIKSIELIILSSFLSSLILFVFSLLFQSTTSFSSFTNLFGVMIGFLTGVYIPIGYYPQIIQSVLFMFPLSQTTSLLRKAMTSDSILDVSHGVFKIRNTIETMFGLKIEIFNNQLSNSEQLFYIITVVGILFILLTIISKVKRA